MLDPNKLVEIDFEFSETSEAELRLFVCSFRTGERRAIERLRLLDDPESYELACLRFEELADEGYTFLAFASAAEARSFYTLGLDPTRFQWIDLYAEFRQIVNHIEKYRYGKQWVKKPKSDPPEYVLKTCYPEYKYPKKDNSKPETNLVNALLKFLGKVRDPNKKDEMRELILANYAEYTEAELAAIEEYCDEDIVDLRALYLTMRKILERYTPRKYRDGLDEAILARGRYAADIALAECQGIPVHRKAVENLSEAVPQIKDEAIRLLCENHYPFYEQKRATKKSPLKWVKSGHLFEKYISERGLLDEWPRTPKGKLSTDRDTLKEYSGLSEINELRRTTDLLKQVSYYRPEAVDKFWSNVGSDDRLRLFFGQYGTQTSRNAPPATLFIPAQSSWLRSVIRAPEGSVIIGADYSSQEFAIAAVLSHDKNMIDSYNSGDPYLHFGKLTGMIPPEGTKHSHPIERGICKAIILGLQFGMGNEKLAISLTNTLGRIVKPREAKKYVDMHKKTYKKLWQFMRNVTEDYKYEPLILDDGWTLFQDNPNALSVRNFPVQGTGGVILRRAVRNLHDMGERAIFPLHDACYIIADESRKEEAAKNLRKAMRDATIETIGETLDIRIDLEYHERAEVWVEEKGEEQFNTLYPYCGISFEKIEHENGHRKYKYRAD